MDTLEVLPTEENLITYLVGDSLDRNKDIIYFYKLLQAQESACAIAIDGRWGSGKTVFVKQLKLLIEALNVSSGMKEDTRNTIKSKLDFKPDESDCSFAIYYDAWKNDQDSEPIYSLIYEITSQLRVDFSQSNVNIPKLACGIITALSKIDFTGIGDAFDEKDPFKVFTEKKDDEDQIREFIASIVSERGNRLVIFIDELDRCKPDFAVKLLEQIKHYMVDDRITFVFSVNLEQLQHTIKHYYGADFDACRYLDRFFNLTISLPPANMKKFYAEIGMDSSRYYVDSVMEQIVSMFRFELREVTRFYTQVKAAAYEVTHDSSKYDFDFPHEKGNQFVLLCVVPLLIGLKIADSSRYSSFINGEDITPLRELFYVEDTKYMLGDALDRKESFIETNGKTVVTYEEVINKIYHAIFVQKYDYRNYRTTVGHYEFNEKSKSFAISVAGMMSKYTCLS